MTTSLPTSGAESVQSQLASDSRSQNATTGIRVSLSPTGRPSVPNNTIAASTLPHGEPKRLNGQDRITTGNSAYDASGSGSASELSGGGSPMKLADADEIDPRFVLPHCNHELPRKELEPVELFVAKAVIEQQQEQDLLHVSTNYQGILDAFRFKRDTLMLRKLLIALRTSGSTLSLLTSESNKHARLIHQIVRFTPFTPDTVVMATSLSRLSQQTIEGIEDMTLPLVVDLASKPCDVLLADAQFRLLFAIVSANSIFLVPTLTTLWKMLTYQITDAHPLRCRYIHAAIATVLRLCPQAKSELFPIIGSVAPFRTRPEAELIWYYKQATQILQYLPSIRDPVLELIVARCLELDVEIKITDVGEATVDRDNEDDDGAIFHLDLDHKDQVTPPEKANPIDSTVDEMADKLDSMMLILFEFAEDSLKYDLISSGEMFRVFSRIFESAILVTYKSKFVQFLILHICGIDAVANATSSAVKENESMVGRADGSTLYRDFAARMIDVVIDPYRATATRQSGACYLASFVSRASFVCVETVCETVDALLRWADAYMHSLPLLSVHAPDAREQCSLHSLFYTVCQAAYYIMCFRGTEVVRFVNGPMCDDPNHPLSYVDLSETKWTRICSHPLLPLQYCLESVRSEFLRLSGFLPLIDSSVLERLMADDELKVTIALKRKKTSSRIITAATLEKERVCGGVGGLGRGTNPLDSFFPFDPYLLRQSHRFIEPFYQHWNGGAIETDMASAINDLDDVEEDAVNVVDTSDDDNESKCQSLNDGSDESESDDDRDLEASNTRKRFMSFGSAATSVSSRPSSLEDKATTGDVSLRRGEIRRAWSQVTKRSRAPSIENGSW